MNKNLFDFKDKTAVITGGAQGFGLDIAKRFLEGGAKVVIWDIDSKLLEKVLNSINNDNLTSNAYYWLGETYYVQKKFQLAAISFARGFQNFPKGNKAIDQLFKLALTFMNLGKNEDACAAFSKLESEFPDAPKRISNRSKEYIKRARNKGILVCCDEIMCGLGRHGQGPAMFLSDSKVWDLDPDAVTFGKAIGGGVYPLSGVALKSGAKELQLSSRSTFQMHTYTGAQTRALMAGEAVCDALPDWYEHIAEMGIVLEEIAKDISDASNGTMVVHGHGMMWGGLFVHDTIDERLKAVSTLKEKCKNVWPYFVPSGGFMITPPIDTNEQDLREVGNRLCRAVEETEKVMQSV